MTYYKKEDRYRMKVDRKGEIKYYYPKSKEQKEKNLQICKENGFKVLECVKLYPFNTYANQHNFDLIHTITMNELYDIWNGEKKVGDEEYNRLENLKEQSEKFFCLPLPVAWLPYKEWAEAKEMATAAILHRQNACIENGRLDLVQYC